MRGLAVTVAAVSVLYLSLVLGADYKTLDVDNLMRKYTSIHTSIQLRWMKGEGEGQAGGGGVGGCWHTIFVVSVIFLHFFSAHKQMHNCIDVLHILYAIFFTPHHTCTLFTHSFTKHTHTHIVIDLYIYIIQKSINFQKMTNIFLIKKAEIFKCYVFFYFVFKTYIYNNAVVHQNLESFFFYFFRLIFLTLPLPSTHFSLNRHD